LQGEAEAVRFRYKLQAQSARVDTLLQEKRSLEARLAELEAQLASGRNQFEAAEERERAQARATAELREQLEEERERVRQQGEAMAQMVSKLQVQLVEEQTANERLRRERERWRKLDDTAAALEAEKTELQREKGELLGDALELKERVKELEQRNAQLTHDVEQLRATRDEGESATADRTRALEEQLREHKREHEAEINALNVLLREQIDSCKRISAEKRSLEAQREHDLEQIEQLMEERRYGCCLAHAIVRGSLLTSLAIHGAGS
jgi:chromosome segregation ATPase